MKLKLTIAALAVTLTLACGTPRRTAFNTIATVAHGVDASYKGYLLLVVKGELKTNSVPAVTGAYVTFQSVLNTTVVLMQGNTNAPPTQPILESAAKVEGAITHAKQEGN